MGELTTAIRTLKIDDMKGLEPSDYRIYQDNPSVLDSEKEEMTFNVNVIEKGSCWRLVHDGKEVLDLFESDGETSSINILFAGTENECLAEIERLGLIYNPK